MLKFKAKDKVKILAGKDKGQDGEIEKVFPKKETALVPNLNIYKKHVKGVSGQKAGIYSLPRPLPFGKLALICPNCKKPTRVGFKVSADKKIRVCKKCKKNIDNLR